MSNLKDNFEQLNDDDNSKNNNLFKQYFKKNPSKFNKFLTMLIGMYREIYVTPLAQESLRKKK